MVVFRDVAKRKFPSGRSRKWARSERQRQSARNRSRIGIKDKVNRQVKRLDMHSSEERSLFDTEKLYFYVWFFGRPMHSARI